MVRSRGFARKKVLAFILGRKIRAVTEDGFHELLLDTMRLGSITVPMMSGVLWLPSQKGECQDLRALFFGLSLALGVEPIRAIVTQTEHDSHGESWMLLLGWRGPKEPTRS
jgi:hypothetical protein